MNSAAEQSISNRFLFASVTSVADQGVSAAVGFLLSVFVARTLGPEALGIFAVSYVVVFLVQSVHNALVLQSMAVFGPRLSPRDRGGYLMFLLLFGGAGVAGLTLVAAVVVRSISPDAVLGKGATAAILAALLYGNVMAALNVLRRWNYVLERPSGALAQSLAFLVATIGAMLLMTRLGHPSVASLYLALSTTAAVVLTIVVVVRGGGMRLPELPRLMKDLRRHWEFGRWLLLAVPFVLGSYQVYYLLASRLESPAAAGLVKAVDTLVLPFDQVCVGLTLLLTPRAARHLIRSSRARRRRATRRLTVGFLVAAGVYAVLLAFGGRTALELLFGEDFSRASHLLPVMALLPVAKSLVFAANIVVMAEARPAINLASRMMATALTATVGVALILGFGALGTAMGLLVSTSTVGVGLYVGLARMDRPNRDGK